MAATAAALDAADGVMDGRHFGRPIVQAGAPAFGSFVGAPAFASYGTTFAQPAFGSFVGAPTPFFGGASSTAAALDAADGVIDGRHFGRPIVQAGAPAFASYGATTINPGFASYGATFAQPAFGGFAGAPAGYFGGASSTAAALDAADGVIDGRHFGRPIVQAAPTVATGAMVPFTGVAGPTYVQAPVSYGAVPSSYYGGYAGYAAPTYGASYVPAASYAPGYGAAPYGGYGVPYGSSRSAQRAQRAATLDAADGVMDGRHFGRPIKQHRGIAGLLHRH